MSSEKENLLNYINLFKTESIKRKNSSEKEWEEKKKFFFNIFDTRMTSIYGDIWVNRFDCSFEKVEGVKELERATLQLPWIESFLGYGVEEIVDVLFKVQKNKEYIKFPPNVNQFASLLDSEAEMGNPMFENFEPLKKRED